MSAPLARSSLIQSLAPPMAAYMRAVAPQSWDVVLLVQTAGWEQQKLSLPDSCMEACPHIAAGCPHLRAVFARTQGHGFCCSKLPESKTCVICMTIPENPSNCTPGALSAPCSRSSFKQFVRSCRAANMRAVRPRSEASETQPSKTSHIAGASGAQHQAIWPFGILPARTKAQISLVPLHQKT